MRTDFLFWIHLNYENYLRLKKMIMISRSFMNAGMAD
jgi:hypothetical protein